jgi:predicted RNase H-like nuclease
MGDPLKLTWYAVAGVFRSRAALQTEVLALRHQLNVLRRRAPKRIAVSNIDRLVCGALSPGSRGVGRGENPQAGDHHQMASRWIPSLVALEIKAARRTAQDT